jgi:hypothetical protein
MGRATNCRIALAAAASFMVASPSAAVVVAPGGTFTAPANSFVGVWNGASGVAIGERWVLSARHVGGSAGSTFMMNGATYAAARVLAHPRADLLLVELDSSLPGWHETGSPPVVGQRVLMAGTGFVAGAETEDGYAWLDQRDGSATWGANIVVRTGLAIATVFDAPDLAIPGEAQYALYDSGGGLFTDSGEGQAQLVGIAIAITGGGRAGAARYGASSYSLSLDPYLAWIWTHAFPGRPVASSVPPPNSYRVPTSEPATTPAPASWLVVVVGAALLILTRRRFSWVLSPES